jgi:cbb3-type cytochrome oxidase subunit 3
MTSSSAAIPFVLGFALAGGLLAAILWLLRRRPDARAEEARRLDLLLAETAAAREASEGVDRRFDEMRRAVEQRVIGVEQRLAEGQKTVADQLVSQLQVAVISCQSSVRPH